MTVDPVEPRPSGEPTAELMEEQLADLVVIDGPHKGEVWVFVAGQGGFMRQDGSDDAICTSAAAVIEHVNGNVRPVTS